VYSSTDVSSFQFPCPLSPHSPSPTVCAFHHWPRIQYNWAPSGTGGAAIVWYHGAYPCPLIMTRWFYQFEDLVLLAYRLTNGMVQRMEQDQFPHIWLSNSTAAHEGSWNFCGDGYWVSQYAGRVFKNQNVTLLCRLKNIDLLALKRNAAITTYIFLFQEHAIESYWRLWMRLSWVRLSERWIEGWLDLTLTSHLPSSLITSVELGEQ